MVEGLDDSILLIQLQWGNDQAIEILYTRYAERLYRFAVKKYHLSPEDAEDAVQTTFCYIIERIHTYDQRKGAGRWWIYAICSHAIIDTQRRKRPQVGIHEIEISSEEYALEEGLVKWERSETIKRTWSRLSEGDRQELLRGRGPGAGRKAWHQAAQSFRALFPSEEDPNDK